MLLSLQPRILQREKEKVERNDLHQRVAMPCYIEQCKSKQNMILLKNSHAFCSSTIFLPPFPPSNQTVILWFRFFWKQNQKQSKTINK